MQHGDPISQHLSKPSFCLVCFQTALNIVKLGPGLAEVKSVDHNAFVIITSKKEYR